VIVGHVAGFPVEETLIQFAPAGAALLTAVGLAVQTQLRRVRRRLRPGDE
jgi:hypothetical protein